jgi:hypothetical protein
MKMPFSFKTLQAICIYRSHCKTYCSAERTRAQCDKCGQSHCEIWSKFKRVLDTVESTPVLQKNRPINQITPKMHSATSTQSVPLRRSECCDSDVAFDVVKKIFRCVECGTPIEQ